MSILEQNGSYCRVEFGEKRSFISSHSYIFPTEYGLCFLHDRSEKIHLSVISQLRKVQIWDLKWEVGVHKELILVRHGLESEQLKKRSRSFFSVIRHRLEKS